MNWGDGSNCQWVRVTPMPDGSFAVVNSHTYRAPGTYRLKVNIAVPGSGDPRANQVTTTAVIAAPRLTSISIDSPNPPIGKRQLLVAGHYSNGTIRPLTRLADWSSSDERVVRINHRGVATPLQPGTADIKATFHNRDGEFSITAKVGLRDDVGYNVITWDPRGEFQSGGLLELDNPIFEGRDISGIIEWLREHHMHR